MKYFWKIEQESGDYVSSSGARWDVTGAAEVSFAPGFTDYVEAEDLAAALPALGLAVYRASGAAATAEFEAACAQFRAVCASIGAFIGAPGFRGGFDEYAAFVESEACQSDPVAGNRLAVAWIGANELAKYTGAKCNLGQPEWWYRCWE